MGLGNGFLDVTLKGQAKKAKVIKQDYIELKSFCTAKVSILWKGNPQNGKKYLKTTYMVIFNIYKDLLQLNRKETNKKILLNNGQSN